MPSRRLVIVLSPPPCPLDAKQIQYEYQQHDRKLRRTRQAVQAEPSVIDPDSEGLDREMVCRSKTVQRFHKRKRQADRDRQPDERQRDLAERRPGPMTQQAARSHHQSGLAKKSHARQQI